MNNKIPWIPINEREGFYKKYWDENYKFLQDNIKAIEAIVKDVLNDFDVIMKPGRKLSKKDDNPKKSRFFIWVPIEFYWKPIALK